MECSCKIIFSYSENIILRSQFNKHISLYCRLETLKNRLKGIINVTKQLEDKVNPIIQDINNVGIKDRLNKDIHLKIGRMEDFYFEWIDKPNHLTETTFFRQCTDNDGMKPILSNFHYEIKTENKDYYNHLLDGGVRNI